MKTKTLSRTLLAVGVLISLATFVLGALPANWGIFLSAACFVVGGMMWPDAFSRDCGDQD